MTNTGKDIRPRLKDGEKPFIQRKYESPAIAQFGELSSLTLGSGGGMQDAGMMAGGTDPAMMG